jgi:hypothetical protein
LARRRSARAGSPAAFAEVFVALRAADARFAFFAVFDFFPVFAFCAFFAFFSVFRARAFFAGGLALGATFLAPPSPGPAAFLCRPVCRRPPRAAPEEAAAPKSCP